MTLSVVFDAQRVGLKFRMSRSLARTIGLIETGVYSVFWEYPATPYTGGYCERMYTLLWSCHRSQFALLVQRFDGAAGTPSSSRQPTVVGIAPGKRPFNFGTASFGVPPIRQWHGQREASRDSPNIKFCARKISLKRHVWSVSETHIHNRQFYFSSRVKLRGFTTRDDTKTFTYKLLSWIMDNGFVITGVTRMMII